MGGGRSRVVAPALILMALTLVTAPAKEPLTLQEAKRQVRVEHNDEDVHLDSLITAVRMQLDGRDGWLGRALVTQTWELTLDRFPPSSACPIRIPLPPLQSVVSVTYVDDAGAQQTWDPAKYLVDAKSEPGRVVPAYGEVYPTTRWQPNAVKVRFVAGYGNPNDVPAPIRLGLLMLVAHWFWHREPVVSGGPVPQELPRSVGALLAPYRVRLLA